VYACLLLFQFFSTKPRGWLRRTPPKWPIFCWVGRKTSLTQPMLWARFHPGNQLYEVKSGSVGSYGKAKSLNSLRMRCPVWWCPLSIYGSGWASWQILHRDLAENNFSIYYGCQRVHDYSFLYSLWLQGERCLVKRPLEGSIDKNIGCEWLVENLSVWPYTGTSVAWPNPFFID